jgi:uncharacterized membrane-anchored protein
MGLVMNIDKSAINKVPAITLGFWIIKILSTTVGETGADFLAVDAGLGQGITTVAMSALLCFALTLQMRSKRCEPWIYWLTVVLVSVVGTQITDLLTDGLGVSLYLSTGIFSLALVAVFAVWFSMERTLSIRSVTSGRREAFYWAVILCTFALGTAAGDLATEAIGLGFRWGIVSFGCLIAVTAIAAILGANEVLCFWIAYILTRPLGASLGDFLTQDSAYDGLGLGAMQTSAIFLVVIVVLVVLAQRSARRLPKLDSFNNA